MVETKKTVTAPDTSGWDWELGEKEIANTTFCSTQFEWIEEFKVSPDGEKIAMVAKVGGFEFSVCENG
ncbi:MAG: hypothetical protein PHO79_02710, partial [Desulfoplanes sp.]|nr:hypothetical protein [Desulfoplanes sp.]